MDAATGERRDRVRIELQRHRTGYEDDVHFYGSAKAAAPCSIGWARRVCSGTTRSGTAPASTSRAAARRQRAGRRLRPLLRHDGAARLDTARGSGGQTLRYEADVPSFDLYFLAGPAPPTSSKRTPADRFPGHAARWSLGYFQSTRFFEDAEDILTVARTMREKQLPCDALIFLSTYGASQGWNAGVFGAGGDARAAATDRPRSPRP